MKRILIGTGIFFAAAKIPTLSGDSGLYIEGLPEEEEPGIFVRRISGGQKLTDDEVLQLPSSHGILRIC